MPEQDFSLKNSIVMALPGAYACDVAPVQAQQIRMDWNIMGDFSCGADGYGEGNLSDATFAQLLLGELGYWGQSAHGKSHLPGAGSIVVDRTPAEFCAPSTSDQRNENRIVSCDGSLPARCDTGAVEVAAGPVDHFIEGFRDGFETDFCGGLCFTP